MDRGPSLNHCNGLYPLILTKMDLQMSEKTRTNYLQSTSKVALLMNPRTFNIMTRLLVSGLMICLGLWIAGGIAALLHQLYVAATGE